MAGALKEATTPEGRLDKLKKAKGKIGGSILNHGFIGLDTFMRVKDGEKLPVALGKAVLTNAAFSMLPGGIIGGMAVMGAMAAPEMVKQLDQAAGGLNAKKQQFGGNFQESEAQFGMLQRGVGSMHSARLQATKVMANHARGAQKVY